MIPFAQGLFDSTDGRIELGRSHFDLVWSHVVRLSEGMPKNAVPDRLSSGNLCLPEEIPPGSGRRSCQTN